MSLDVYLIGEPREVDCECPTCENKHTRTTAPTYYSNNVTHNLCAMAHEAGVYACCWRPDEHGMVYARDIIGPLEAGHAALLADPARFRALNPANGWGSYQGFLSFVCGYLAACREYPDARIEVSR